MTNIIIIVGLIAFIVYCEIVHTKQKNDLLDRLMSRDLTQYKTMAEPIAPKESVSMSDFNEYKRDCIKKGIIPEKDIN